MQNTNYKRVNCTFDTKLFHIAIKPRNGIRNTVVLKTNRNVKCRMQICHALFLFWFRLRLWFGFFFNYISGCFVSSRELFSITTQSNITQCSAVNFRVKAAENSCLFSLISFKQHEFVKKFVEEEKTKKKNFKKIEWRSYAILFI